MSAPVTIATWTPPLLKMFPSTTGLAVFLTGNKDDLEREKNKAAMLETISNVIKFVTSMQLHDGRNLALEDGPMRSLFLQLMEVAGVSPLLLTKMQAPAPVQQPVSDAP